MMNGHCRYLGKWSAFCAVAVVFAASGQACPPGMPVPVSSLAGLWTGPISGDVTAISILGSTSSSPNPNPQTFEEIGRVESTQQIVFNDAGLPTTLPLPVSAFDPSFNQQAVTAFNVGEVQTISTSFTQTFPTGATDTFTIEQSTTTTLTVMESVLSADHFRVAYATTNVIVFSQTSTAAGFVPVSITRSSTGTLTIDALALDGLVMFSVDFNNNGTAETVIGATTKPGSGFSVGSLVGTLAAD